MRTSFDRLAFTRLAWQSGPVEIRVANLELVDAVVTISSTPALRAARAHLQGVEILLPEFHAARSRLPKASGWRLDALDALEGRIEAFITDAHWALDADVTLPIEQGRVDFNRVTVEHIGPDSSMGISHMGLYVDAPNGRTYLYLFDATHVPGASFERRGGSLFGAGVADRGALALRPFVESLLAGMALGAPAQAANAQLDRTRLSGMLQLGDGPLGVHGHEVTLEGRAQGRNRISLSAEAVGKAVIARLPEFSAASARLEGPGRPVRCGAITAALSVSLERGSARLVADEVTVAELAVGEPPAE